MSLYLKAAEALGLIDDLHSLSEGIQDFIEADNGADMAAAAGKIAAEVSVGIIVTRAVRTSCSLIRLGLAVSGKVDRWDALSKTIGIGAGLSAGELIDWINSFPNGSNVYDWTHPDDSVASAFNAAQNWTPRRDPLTLDLDGDGLETVAPSNTKPILFDHDGDGVKNGTGWVKPDDGFLVVGARRILTRCAR